MVRNLLGYSPWDHKESDMTERPKHTPLINNVVVVAGEQ